MSVEIYGRDGAVLWPNDRDEVTPELLEIVKEMGGLLGLEGNSVLYNRKGEQVYPPAANGGIENLPQE